MGAETEQVVDKEATAARATDAQKAPGLHARGIPVPPLAPATLPGRSAVALMQARIGQARHGAVVWRDFNLDVVAMLDAREHADSEASKLPDGKPNPASGLSSTDAAIRDNAKAEAAKAGTVFAAATKDLRALASAATPETEFNEIIARRGLWVQTRYQFSALGSELLREEATDHPGLPTGWSYAKNRLTRTGGQAESSLEIDPEGRPTAITREANTSASVGWDSTLGNLTATSGRSTKQTTVKGGRKEERAQGTTQSLSVGTITGYTRDVVRDKVTITPGGEGKKQVMTDSSRLTVDSAGVSYGTTTSLQEDDQLSSRTRTAAFKRGDGTATLGGTISAKKGTVDEEGTLTKGRGHALSGGAGLYSDKDLGTGLGVDAAADNTYTRKGLDLGMKIGGGGRWFVNVKKVEGSPDQVLLVTSIVVSASLTVKAGSGAAFTGGIAASDRATFAHRVSIEEAKDYLAIMASKGEGGTMPEHLMLRAGFRDGWGAVRKAWQARNPEAVAADAAGLAKDEYQERDNERTLTGGAALKVTAGDVELGGSYGRTSKSQLTSRVTGSDDTSVDVSLTLNQVDTDSFGANMKLGVAGGSFGRDLGVSAGQVFVFHVPKGETATIAELLRATTAAELGVLWGKYPALLKGRSELKGKTDTEKLGVSIGSLTPKLAGTGAYGQKVDYDEKGSRTGATYTGSSDTGGSVDVGSVDISATDQRTYTGSVDDKAGANNESRSTGKAERGSTSFSAAKTWQAVKDLRDPLKVVTDGPGSLIRNEKSIDRSMYYGDEDINAIVWQAHDERAWMSKVASPNRRPDWRRTMLAIKRASRWRVDADGRNGHYEYDAHKVQQALATWNSVADPDRLNATDSLVRGSDGTGGVVAAFPAPLAAFEADFRRYAVQDQIRDSKTLKAADDAVAAGLTGPADPAIIAERYGKALAELKIVQGRLEVLYQGLKDQAGQFTTPGMHAELMGRIVLRLNAVRNEISSTQERITESRIAVKASAPIMTKGGKVDAAAVAQRDADVAAAEKAAGEEKRVQDAKAGEAEARTNFDQMWRHSADINRLVDQAHYLYTDSVYNAEKATRALNDAKGQLTAWGTLRTRNEALVSRHTLGDWLRGPDPATLRPRYSTVWDEVHQGY